VAALPIIAIIAAVLVVVASYLAGRVAGKRETIPWRPIFQLVDHYTRCRGEDPAAVRARITAELQIPSWAWQELLRRREPLVRGRRTIRPEARV
jgi:hypothetical protein